MGLFLIQAKLVPRSVTARGTVFAEYRAGDGRVARSRGEKLHSKDYRAAARNFPPRPPTRLVQSAHARIAAIAIATPSEPDTRGLTIGRASPARR